MAAPPPTRGISRRNLVRPPVAKIRALFKRRFTIVKKIEVTDHQYDWFFARTSHGMTMSTEINRIIALVDRYESDLAKYQKWVDASQTVDQPKLSGKE